MSDKKVIDVTSPYFVSPSDNSGIALVLVVLNGQNYHTWAKAMLRVLEAKNKTRFIDGSLKQPDLMSPENRLWKINNFMICSWIFNSLDRSLQGAAVHASNAKTIEDEIKQQFAQGNAPRIQQIKTNWVSDMSASMHMTGNVGLLSDVKKLTHMISIGILYGKSVFATKSGNICLPNFVIKNILFIPGLDCNLILAGRLLVDLDCILTFYSRSCELKDRATGRMIGMGEL
ncbi:hypothetical protein CRG98_033381 [Punica granatum]|uniref:Uncharacterized protein n=1 Tax=Punica granatum TaxID=22663 RepID=A0A2I0IQG6_PUNGR|nr:hypothetical protein CRG98_033381 [Punica granatum]